MYPGGAGSAGSAVSQGKLTTHHALQGRARHRLAGPRPAEDLQQGRHRGGRLAAALDVHQGGDPLDGVVGRDGGRGRKVGLVDRAAHLRHAPQGLLLGRLLPLRRVPPRRDLGDAPFPDLVPGLALGEAEGLHRRRRWQRCS